VFNQLRFIFKNLLAGLRLCLALPAPLARFVVSADQAVLLPLWFALLVCLVQFWRAAPEAEFVEYGFADQSLGVLGVLLTGYLTGKWLGRERAMVELIVLVYSVAPFTYLVWQALEGLMASLSLEDTALLLQGSFLLWTIAIALGVFWRLSAGRWRRLLPATLAYFALVSVPAQLLGEPLFWRAAEWDAQADNAAPPLNAESVFYAQFERMGSATKQLLPERPGVTDLYFLGFAGHGQQDVFMKEVKFARALFDHRFDTAGRSLVLINNAATIDQDPIASSNNLREALYQIGQRMNPQEDMLFLFITSHGYEDHHIDVSLNGVPLNSIDPNDLRDYLDEAGIRWRVLMVSACYSGGFVEPLRDPYTLVATAAASDRTSFGCDTAATFTYFGQAVLEEQLAAGRSFVDAFTAARKAIAAREAREGLEPSLPQLEVGAAIADKLAQWQQQRVADVALACKSAPRGLLSDQSGVCEQLP